MKKTATLITICLMVLSFGAFSNKWNTPNEDDGRSNFYFSYQKDVEGNIGAGATAQSSVVYNGKIFNFIYSDLGQAGSRDGIITMRIIENQPTAGSPDMLSWKITNGDDGEDILGSNDEIRPYQQPASVVYKGVLYLFYSDDSLLHYKTYNDETGQWTYGTYFNDSYNDDHILGYGAATVIGDKLCLVHHYDDNHLRISWTTDPSNPDGWQHSEFEASVYKDNRQPGVYWNPISVIARTYMKNNAVSQKLQVAYITPNKDARFAEYEFDATGTPVQLQNVVIESGLNYTSVALAQGTVYNDPNSTGNCTQLFLRKSDTDNGYLRYRILRWELKEGAGERFHRVEKNIVPQNSPYRMWADKELNLTVTNFSILDDDSEDGNMKQYMVLVYRGYDDWNHPLNCAWSRTDDLKYESNDAEQGIQQDLDQDNTSDPRKFRQYIGYIEGPPPFHKNHPSLSSPNNAYINQSALAITEVEYEYMETTELENELKFESSINTTLHVGPVKSEIAYAHSQKQAYKSEETHVFNIALAADTICEGMYLYMSPIITRTTYGVYDKLEHLLYPVYCFTMQMVLHEDVEELKNGLEADNPQTYQHRKVDSSDINFGVYQRLSSAPITPFDHTAGTVTSSSVEIATGNSQTNTRSRSVKLNLALGEVFEMGIEKTAEYSSTVTTVEKNKVKFSYRFNTALDPTDVKKLQYYSYWILPKTGLKNWWLKDTDINPDQNTWCITYRVGQITLKDGTIITGAGNDPDSHPYFEAQEQSVLSPASPGENQTVNENLYSVQCYPNPFSSKTKIKYQIGANDLSANKTGDMTKLVVYNLSGQLVATLVNETKAPGSYEVEWDASRFTPGVYFYSLQSGSFKDVKKLILLK
jgi:hypothetical protein